MTVVKNRIEINDSKELSLEIQKQSSLATSSRSFNMDLIARSHSIAEIRRRIAMNQQEQLKATRITRSEKGYNVWRDYDLLTCLIAMVGLLLTVCDYEYTF